MPPASGPASLSGIGQGQNMTHRSKIAPALCAALFVAGCGATPEALGVYDYEVYELQTQRAYAAAYSETPFANGAMSVISAEGDRLRTYLLAPCRGGTAICAGGEQGRAGTLSVTPDYHIVRGVYGNRAFYLSPGGDGAVLRGSVAAPLAWNSILPE